LIKASQGPGLSKYHLEAAIAYEHTIPANTPEKWENILQYYNQLLVIAYSPIAALNRTYALAKANGKAVAIVEAEKLKLVNSHLYYSLLGYLYTGMDNAKAMDNFKLAFDLAKSDADREALRKKMNKLN